jgi:hypothetical protein
MELGLWLWTHIMLQTINSHESLGRDWEAIAN